MESKKLLKFLLKDLSELDELISEKKENSFDELEMEFLQTRVSGAKRMIQILHDREGLPAAKDPVEGNAVIEEKEELEPEKTVVVEETINKQEIKEFTEPELVVGGESKIEVEEEHEVELQEEKVVDEANHRLGDSFSKEKSVNDLIDAENSNLEHKLSNRPVESIKKSIGINDRFQYIRELFEGSAEKFVNAVTELDEKKDINEAVDYLKKNFEWKKNETSLKFVNLVKRRFSNE
jgi:hypothetical protein